MRDIRFIDRDTRLYLSISERPGNSGTRLFNRLFDHFGMNCVYKAARVGAEDLEGAIAGFRALGIAGGGVSMPLKVRAVALMDEIDETVSVVGALNTIVRTESSLRGYNTDLIAAKKSLCGDPGSRTLVLGAGGVARAVAAALQQARFSSVIVAARKPEAAAALAAEFGHSALDWKSAISLEGVAQVINCTPLGMSGSPELEPSAAWRESVRHVVDLPIREDKSALVQWAESAGIPFVSGARFSAWQAIEQFRLYTGKVIDENLVREVLA